MIAKEQSMASSELTFDIFAEDNASPALLRVADAADKAAQAVERLQEALAKLKRSVDDDLPS